MKKLLLLALALMLSSVLYAQSGPGPNRKIDKSSEGWKAMNDIHELMHNTSITGDKIENGVFFEITATSESTIGAIKKRFVTERDKLDAFFNNVDVTVSELNNGVKISLESDDKKTVARLQEYGPATIFRYLHSSVFMDQTGWESDGPMGNDHDCCVNGMGHGPGMMHQDQDDDDTDSTPGTMHWDDGYRGNHPGMMQSNNITNLTL